MVTWETAMNKKVLNTCFFIIILTIYLKTFEIHIYLYECVYMHITYT